MTKFLLTATVVLLVGAGAYVALRGPTPAPAPTAEMLDHGHDHAHPQVASAPAPAKAAPVLPADRLGLRDAARDPKERVKTIRELKLGRELTPAAQELVMLVISANPVALSNDPHSASSYQHQREAALRVFALRRLSEELALETFTQTVEQIEREADDPALVNIAREALKAKERGGNYFQELTEGIRSAPLPR